MRKDQKNWIIVVVIVIVLFIVYHKVYMDREQCTSTFNEGAFKIDDTCTSGWCDIGEITPVPNAVYHGYCKEYRGGLLGGIL